MSSIACEKAEAFAIRIVNLYKFLVGNNEYVLSKQILRSGTSIGANLAESQLGMSKKDFLAKVYISLKECAETKYWLNLLYKTEYISCPQYESLNADCQELLKILNSITKTTTESLKQ